MEYRTESIEEMEQELVEERRALSLYRIREIADEKSVPEPYRDYFAKLARYILLLEETADFVKEGKLQTAAAEELADRNRALYRDILPKAYETSYGNPLYAVCMLGEEYGQLLCAVYAEVHRMVTAVYEDRLWDRQIVMELFLEIYNMFCEEELPKKEDLRNAIYWYVSDYTDETMENRVRGNYLPILNQAVKVIKEADLTDLRYLYMYGEYVTENECKTAEFLNSLSEEQIEEMARTYTEGYRIGFIQTRKDMTKKKTVAIRYQLGFERMVRAAVRQFEQMGLTAIITHAALHLAEGGKAGGNGAAGASANRQYAYDHREDLALIFDEDLVQRRLRAMQVICEKYTEEMAAYGGPAVIETFGEKPFAPQSNPYAPAYQPKQQKLQVKYANEQMQITQRHVHEYSFTIIAYPVPEIGGQFEEIFRETVRINTLDYQKYQRIQQHLIDALDQGTCVHIKGKGENRTDLTVQLHRLADRQKETNFENCVADVNIPVGEVFTSPVLKGTDGILHVSSVFLRELRYDQLCLELKDGRIASYSCANFETEEENRSYIEKNLLYHHETLPLGEFAIGTNTTAYVMAKKYGIAEKLPILIAEKMGPHFAVGDTCYSWEEDTPVYNPDGKEIIARDNEISLLRKEEPGKAYFGCHTDITIPYDELAHIRVLTEDGREIALIEDGRFVLPGTEELNEAFEE